MALQIMSGFCLSCGTIHTYFLPVTEIYGEWGTMAALRADEPRPEFSPDAMQPVQDAVSRLRGAKTKGALGLLLSWEVETYTIFDLQIIGGRLNSEIEKLPSPYREAIRPYFRDQLFGRHHQLLENYRSGAFTGMDAPLRDPALFLEFCNVIPSGCFSLDDSHERNPFFRNPKNRLFYYLIAAFAMFVLDEPGHPVGMPFPGGFTVEQRGREYYCLIRDKEKEVPTSICNFCPARQKEDT